MSIAVLPRMFEQMMEQKDPTAIDRTSLLSANGRQSTRLPRRLSAVFMRRPPLCEKDAVHVEALPGRAA
jgi:hypothetical protein